jgi:hypothetical protein
MPVFSVISKLLLSSVLSTFVSAMSKHVRSIRDAKLQHIWNIYIYIPN